MESKFEILQTGEKEVIFSHANAYTPRVYLKFFRHLNIDATIYAPKHRPLWDRNPKNIQDWSIFRDDIIQYMDKNHLSGIVGIGHSLGAVALWMASIKRPDLLSSLILIDPVILPKDIAGFIKYLPYALKKRMRPVIKIASKRKDTWKSREEVHDYLLTKKIFKRFDAEVYDAFIKYGMIDNQDGSVSLAYPRAWEARVYASAQNIWAMMHKSSVPMTIIRAQFSNVINDENWSKTMKLVPNCEFIEMPDVGHLIPFEKPEECAKVIYPLLK